MAADRAAAAKQTARGASGARWLPVDNQRADMMPFVLWSSLIVFVYVLSYAVGIGTARHSLQRATT